MSLLIRADGNSQIGTGHLMRCLALVQAWQAEKPDPLLFVMTDGSPGLTARLAVEKMKVINLEAPAGSLEDAAQTVNLAHQFGARWVVVDGYHFDTAYQQAIKAAGLQLLVIDDYGHATHYYADIVLNQNIYASESLYSHREVYTRLLLGPEYVLLRREFWPWRGWRREIAPVARKVLVTLGGSDPDNVTLKVIQALQKVEVEGLEARVVVGPANPHLAVLQQAVEQWSDQIQLLTEVMNMPELMAWADIAISAGGSTCWELALLGVPTLILVLAKNQIKLAEGVERADMAINLNWFHQISDVEIVQTLINLINDKERRQQMSGSGQQLVDGHGTSKVIEAFR